jgi:hypothetical protein
MQPSKSENTFSQTAVHELQKNKFYLLPVLCNLCRVNKKLAHARQSLLLKRVPSTGGKGKVVPVHAIKAHSDSRRIVPLILNLSAR